MSEAKSEKRVVTRIEIEGLPAKNPKEHLGNDDAVKIDIKASVGGNVHRIVHLRQPHVMTVIVYDDGSIDTDFRDGITLRD